MTSSSSSSSSFEDLDGWRGYFAPFTTTTTTTTTTTAATSTTTATSEGGGGGSSSGGGGGGQHQQQIKVGGGGSGIVGLATCRGTRNTSTGHCAVLLAVITRNRVTVWEDPHLHLSCRRPLVRPTITTTTSSSSKGTTSSSSSSSSSSTTSIIYKMQSEWNEVNDGQCRVVDVFCYSPAGSSGSTGNDTTSTATNLVAVGTTTGVVIVYVITTTTVTTMAHNKSNTSKIYRLRTHLRIPPPPSSISSIGGGERGQQQQTGAATSSSSSSSTTSNTGGAAGSTTSSTMEVVSVKISMQPSTTSTGTSNTTTTGGSKKASIFVGYRRRTNNSNNHSSGNTNAATSSSSSSAAAAAAATTTAGASTASSSTGICCYDFPLPSSSLSSSSTSTILTAPSARHDLDGRTVGASTLIDSYQSPRGLQITVARSDGLYSYEHTSRTGVAPIDGQKLVIALVPPPMAAVKAREVESTGYALVASTDAKSSRDVVDIYDTKNKLIGYHMLLSPGHRAICAVGMTTLPTTRTDGTIRSGRSSVLILTSAGSIISLTEKVTTEKIDLLVQKSLYSAAIIVAYSDPSYDAIDITALYRKYAEHLYRKNDFVGSIEQYMNTIGSLESSHVIFRFLDAPKIPLLVKYLEKLRTRDLATPIHNELLRTCYRKLNDNESADAISTSVLSQQRSTNNQSSILTSIISNISNNPKEALATICSLDAQQAVEILIIHGASLARVLPRETAGIIISLCVGTYSPKALADAALATPNDLQYMIDYNNVAITANSNNNNNNRINTTTTCEPYPVHLFASSFTEHPNSEQSKMLRLILAHCNRSRCSLTPTLRRTLLELTLVEWNQAKRSGDTEAEKLRYKEAITALTDSHFHEIGDYDALVIVKQAGFEEGELLLYERLQMTPMLLERYAKDGTEKARRKMLAICQNPEFLPDILGSFVTLANEKIQKTNLDRATRDDDNDDDSEDDEVAEIMEDIQEVLRMARSQGVLPPVRIARILAGEGTGQFSSVGTTSSSSSKGSQQQQKKNGTSSSGNGSVGVPLSVALDYVGTILEESRKEVSRLKSEVEEYNQLCNSMEQDIDSLLRASHALPPSSSSSSHFGGGGIITTSSSSSSVVASRMNIDELTSRILQGGEDGIMPPPKMNDQTREAFWREMNQSEDSFDTIARFFAKGVIE